MKLHVFARTLAVCGIALGAIAALGQPSYAQGESNSLRAGESDEDLVSEVNGETAYNHEVNAIAKEEVNAIAKEITVKISGESNGSGVIFERDGNTYYVLTNRHVVEKDGRYEIQTPDGEIYPVYYSQQISGLDLIVLKFKSSKTYPTATLGDSDQMAQTTTVYVAGWADALPGTNERAYQFTFGQITSRLQNPDNGYALIYDNPTIPGTSGGPMLDENGQLVGINGQVDFDHRTGIVFSLGIPINTFLAALNNREQPEESSPSRWLR